MRGVVSLAAALALPYALDSGAPFPHRDLILFVTFGVIIVTLVGQGLHAAERGALARLDAGAAARSMRANSRRNSKRARPRWTRWRSGSSNSSRERELPGQVIELLRTRNLSRNQILPKDWQDGLDQMRLTAAIKKELIDAEREFVYQLLREGKISDEARRRIEYELDLEEASLANRGQDGGGWM